MMGKKIVIIFLILFKCYSMAYAQDAKIHGVVLDDQNKLPVEFASITLIKLPDTVIISGLLTRQNGEFSFTKVNAEDYLLKVVALGYQTKISPLQISTKNQVINLDTISLSSSSNLLSEITITGVQSPIRASVDRQTYQSSQFESAKGGNAIDILKNLPSIFVNSTGEIQMRGSTGFLILINGKPVNTDAATVLSQLPANTIENIEVLTAPTAKYDADGKAGIINIITKKGISEGSAAQINLLVGLPSTTSYNNLENPTRMGGDISFYLKKEKIDFTISANYTRNDANGQRDGEVYTKNLLKNIITYFPSKGERSYDRHNYGIRTALSYTVNQNNVFNLGFFASKKYQQRRADIVYYNSTRDLTTNALLSQFDYFNSNLQNKEGKFILGSMDFQHSFKNDSKLSAALIYEFADLYGNTLNNNLDLLTRKTVFQAVTNPYTNPIQGYRLKLDYSKNIGTGKLEAGYQYRNDKQDGKFDFTITPVTNLDDISKFKGNVQSSNQINSLYTQYQNTVKKWQYTAGIRYEHAYRDVALSTDLQANKLTLNNLFPSINTLYTVNDSWNIKAGFSKRVQRNNNFELNPIPEREHSETLEQGDPNLLPQFIDLIELGVIHNFNKGSLFSTLYFQNIKNPIQRVNSVYADTILNRLFTNAGRAKLIGLELGTTIKPSKWFSTYIGANIYNYAISGELDVLGSISNVNNADLVYSINLNSTFNLRNNLSSQININYLSARPTAQGEDSRFLSPNLTLNKTFGNGKYKATLQWQNIDLGIFNANQQRISTWGSDFYTTTNYIYESDVLVFNFSINLNKLNTKVSLPASELGEKEFFP